MSLRHTLWICLLLAAASPSSALALTPAAPDTSKASPSVLIVLSSAGRDGGKTRPGFEMDELAQAWGIFVDNGLQVRLASPAGGKVEADAYNARDAANARLLAHAGVMAQLEATARIDELDPAAYDAVYVVGGKGAMLDLAEHPGLAALLGRVYDRGGLVAAVCHGSAALAEVRLADGRRLIEGRRVTGFSAEEESVFGKKWSQAFPFVLEDGLRARGARWVEAPLMMPMLAVDERLITGQNPYSTHAVAEALVRGLGMTPQPRVPDRDEASLALLQRALAGSATAVTELADAPARFHPELIGIIGHYQLQLAQDDAAVRAALVAMDLAAPYMTAPELSLSRAEAHRRLGRRDQARSLLDRVLATHPQLPEAQALMRRLDE